MRNIFKILLFGLILASLSYQVIDDSWQCCTDEDHIELSEPIDDNEEDDVSEDLLFIGEKPGEPIEFIKVLNHYGNTSLSFFSSVDQKISSPPPELI